MKLTRDMAYGLWRIFRQISGRATTERLPVRFVFTVESNIRVLSENADIINATMKTVNTPSDAQEKYDKARVVICKELCDKDEKGNPIILNPRTPNEQYKFTPEALEKVNERVEALKLEHPEAMQERDEKEKQWKELVEEELDEDTCKKIKRISISNCPDILLGNEVRMLGPNGADLLDE